MADVMFIAGTGDIKRKEFMLFADVSADGDGSAWEIVGKKIEEMSLEMNPNIETMTDVTGSVETTLDKYEKQTTVSPYYARRDSKMAKWLYNVVRDEKTLSDVEKTFMCVNIFAGSDGAFDAWTQKAIVAVQSFGGNTKGLQIPYNIHWVGEKTFGTVALAGGVPTFSPARG